jgi:hypothetical protein
MILVIGYFILDLLGNIKLEVLICSYISRNY